MRALLGSWNLVSTYRRRGDGTRVPYLGENPRGRLTYTGDGRVHAIMVADDRPKPLNRKLSDSDKVRLFESCIAYSGTYVVEGNQVTHRIDLSCNELWSGEEKVRHFELSGDSLHILTEPTPDPSDGAPVVYVVEWQRAE